MTLKEWVWFYGYWLVVWLWNLPFKIFSPWLTEAWNPNHIDPCLWYLLATDFGLLRVRTHWTSLGTFDPSVSLLGLFWELFSFRGLKRKQGKRAVGACLLYRQQERARKIGILAWEEWHPDTGGKELAFLLQESMPGRALWSQLHHFSVMCSWAYS